MKKLGEQWIEMIDGQEHMVKAVEGVLCAGCMYSGMSFFGTDKRYNLHLCSYDGICPVGAGDRYNLQIPDISIKDLGPVNEDGCLAEERTGLFPKVSQVFDNLWKAFIYVNNDLEHIEVVVYGKTKQQAIDAWNRRTV